MTANVVVGAEGMTALEYQLTKAGPVVYRGAVTGQTYVFGGKYRIGLVDNRDVPALISRIEDRRHAFAYAHADMPLPILPEPEPIKKGPVGEMITEPIREEAQLEPAAVTEEPARPKRGRKAKA